MKAKEIQWRLQKEFEDILIRISGCSGKEVSDVWHRGSADRIWHVWQFDNLDHSEKEVIQSWSAGPQDSYGSHASFVVTRLRAVAL